MGRGIVPLCLHMWGPEVNLKWEGIKEDTWDIEGGSLTSSQSSLLGLFTQLAPRTTSLCHLLRTVNTVRGHYAHPASTWVCVEGPKPCTNTPKTCRASALTQLPAKHLVFYLGIYSFPQFLSPYLFDFPSSCAYTIHTYMKIQNVPITLQVSCVLPSDALAFTHKSKLRSLFYHHVIVLQS